MRVTTCFWRDARLSWPASVSGKASGSKRASKSLDEAAGDAGVGGERRLDVVLRERRAGLAEVLRHGAQDDHLAPREAGGEHERIEAVGLGPAVPDGPEGLLEALADVGREGSVAGPPRAGVGAQAEVEDVQRAAVGTRHLVGALVGHLDTEVGEERQHLRQGQVGAAVEP